MATKAKLEESVVKKGMYSLEFKVGFDGKPEKPIKVVAYIFDRQGKLLASEPVRGDSVKLALKLEKVQTARVFFAPEHPQVGVKKTATLELMDRLHAYEVSWEHDARKHLHELLPIPEYFWKWWFFCMCRVRGQVVKPVNIDGDIKDMPVCHARVHICEVDPILWLIPRLPDRIIIRLRDELLHEIEFPRPIPFPDPPPFRFDPGVIDPSPLNLAKMNRASQSTFKSRLSDFEASVQLNPQPEPPAWFKTLEAINELNPQPEPPHPDYLRRGSEVMLKSQSLPLKENAIGSTPLNFETRAALNSQSIHVVRQALQNNVELIRPYICWWRWIWPWLCRCDEIETLITGPQGRFDTMIWYRCDSDHPDLYFWVEYLIGGAWTTVYHPNPICCNTYWNYICGSDVTLRVTDPRVAPCGVPIPDLDGLQVAILGIGNGVSVFEIPVDSTAAAPISATQTEGLANGTHPFGGQLEPHVNFSRTELFKKDITHYRWSYRQLTGSDGSTPLIFPDSWHVMDRRVVRHYQVYDPTTSTLTYPADILGPDPAIAGESLFRIQPINAPTGRPEDWTPNVDAREDSASAFFLSYLTQGGDASFGAGKYELKFELFKIIAGVPEVVNFTDEGIALKVPNVIAPFGSGEVTFDDADLHHRFMNGGDTVGFRLVLRVDNNPCQAGIYQVYVDTTGNAAGDCGFIRYDDKNDSIARISFMAYHPNKFATFSFVTAKGNTGGVAAASDSGQVNQGGVDANNFTNTPATGLYWKDVSVAELLNANGVECTKAAFCETLHVDAMATDGWSLLEYLDRDGVPTAFALEPQA